jgi:divalent metal cation (Fe/Co/Zn/Cd) transporter
MSSSAQVEGQKRVPGAAAPVRPDRRAAIWLQSGTLLWLLVECGVSAYAAITSHSSAIAAFGSDSLVELLSAAVVLAQWVPGVRIQERTATRIAASLLFLLALVVTAIASASLLRHRQPDASGSGLAITAAALVVMPILAALKRREARRSGNRALAADAVQSATCAYLALLSLVGLGANAFFHLGWVDSVAALVAVPLLLKEAREAWNGATCSCC